MNYGIHKSGSGLLSDIARSLMETTKLGNTIDRLATNLVEMEATESDTLWQNYLREVEKVMPEEPVFLFDDTDIAKPYGKEFEDLDKVKDGSSPNEKIVKGYHVCECVVLSEKEKQPLSIYSKIYSTKSDGFISKNTYTLKSIKRAREMADGKEMTCVLDRGYDSDQFINELDKEKTTFILRINDRRKFLFKDRNKRIGTVAQQRKGKIKMTLLFDDNQKHEVYISHTRARLPFNGREYTVVIVYGLSEEKPLILLTNKRMKEKDDVIRVVRHYFSRWRVEEYFRAKKQQYGFENMRVRSLKAMNNFNLMTTLVLGHIGKLAESVDSKLLSIKAVVRSKSLRKKVLFWYYQLSRGIRDILSHAKTGITQLHDIEVRSSIRQMRFNL
jgi:hypothetical protein